MGKRKKPIKRASSIAHHMYCSYCGKEVDSVKVIWKFTEYGPKTYCSESCSNMLKKA